MPELFESVIKPKLCALGFENTELVKGMELYFVINMSSLSHEIVNYPHIRELRNIQSRVYNEHVTFKNIPSRTVPCRTMPFRTVPCRTMPSRTTTYRAVPSRNLPYRTMLSRTMPSITVLSKSLSQLQLRPTFVSFRTLFMIQFFYLYLDLECQYFFFLIHYTL